MAALKSGSWSINGNGFSGTFVVGGVDPAGNLTNCSAFGNKVIGFWDEQSRKLTFLRIVTPSDPGTYQVYTGYLMTDLKTLAGSFVAFSGSGGTAQQPVFGWSAKAP